MLIRTHARTPTHTNTHTHIHTHAHAHTHTHTHAHAQTNTHTRICCLGWGLVKQDLGKGPPGPVQPPAVSLQHQFVGLGPAAL